MNNGTAIKVTVSLFNNDLKSNSSNSLVQKCEVCMSYHPWKW